MRCDVPLLTCAISQPRMAVKLLVNTTTRKREIGSFGTWALDSGLKQLALHSSKILPYSVWHGLSRFDPTIRP
jgi:hypothetical protein